MVSNKKIDIEYRSKYKQYCKENNIFDTQIKIKGLVYLMARKKKMSESNIGYNRFFEFLPSDMVRSSTCRGHSFINLFPTISSFPPVTLCPEQHLVLKGRFETFTKKGERVPRFFSSRYPRYQI